MSGWKSVSIARPCSHCGGSDWCSYIEGSVDMCHRPEKCLPNEGVENTTKDGALVRYFFAEGSRSSRDVPEPAIARDFEIADAATLDAVYTALLGLLKPLEGHHDIDLRRRGYDTAEIREVGFRAWPPPEGTLRHLVERFRATLLTVPGFFLEDGNGKKPRFALARLAGYVIPLRDSQGRVVALQLRLDEETPSGSKYLSFSAGEQRASCGGQLRVGTPVSTFVGPVGPDLWLTEGAHKAQALARRGLRALALPSAGSTALALGDVEEVRPRRVILALDADARSKPSVAGALRMAVHTLMGEGYTVGLASWTSDLGKGIDDVIVAGRFGEVEVVEGLQLLQVVRDLSRAAGAPTDPLLEARITLFDLPARASADPSIASRKEILSAAARMAENGAEGERFMEAMKAALPGRFTAWRREVKEAGKQAKKAEKKTRAVQSGRPVFARGDEADLAEHLLAALSAEVHEAGKIRVVAPVAAEGLLYRYVPERGIWDVVTEDDSASIMRRWQGALVGDEGCLMLSHARMVAAHRLTQKWSRRPDFFDRAPALLVFADIAVSLETGSARLLPHSPEHRARHAYPFAYVRPGPGSRKPDQWLQLLRDDFEGDEDRDEKIAAIQEFVGGALFGFGPRFQQAMFFYGPTASNGKTTVGAIIQSLFPRGSVCTLHPKRMGEKFQDAVLAGARLNYVDEIGSDPIENPDDLKAIIAAIRPIAIERKNQDPTIITPVASHLIGGNCFPRATDYSNGFFRRWILIGFNRTFPERGGIDIKSLTERIIEAETAHIITWAIEGAERLLAQRGYTIPSSHHTLMAEWLQGMDPVQAWVAEDLIVVEGDDVTGLAKIEQLFPMFEAFATRSRCQQIKAQTLASRLARWRVRHRTLGVFYRLKPKADAVAAEREARAQAAVEELDLGIAEPENDAVLAPPAPAPPSSTETVVEPVQPPPASPPSPPKPEPPPPVVGHLIDIREYQRRLFGT